MASIIRDLPLPVFVVMIAFGLAMAGVVIAAGLHAQRRAKLISDTPTSNIGMASDGYCEFEGVVEAIGGQTVTAPLTQSPCVWYHAKVEKWVSRSTSQGSSYWATAKETTSHAPFFVRDATGVCIVQPDGGEVTPTDKSQWIGGGIEPTDRNPARLPPTESTTPIVEVSGGPNSRFRYSEERIYDGNPLLVLGEFSRGRFDTPEEEPDDEDDGEFDEDSARDAPADEASAADDDFPDDWVLSEKLTEEAVLTTGATISRGSGAKPFILSTTPQVVHIMMSDMGGKGALYIALAPLAVVAFLLWIRFR